MTKPLHVTRDTPTRLIWFAGMVGIVVMLALALWLRWQYATQVQLHVDEFTTLWAALQVQEKGAPLMPSGVFYTRGILTSYLVALAQQIAGNAPLVGRTVSIFFGVGAVLAIFLAGRREWTARVGWVAALGLTLLPEVIVWSGRARFYSPLLFFALLTLWAAYAMIRLPQDAATGAPRARWGINLLFATLFTLALFSQEQTIMLYPAIVLALLAWRGWRYLLQPPVAVAQLLVLSAIALRFGIEQVGQPGYFEAMQSHKTYLQLFDDMPGALLIFRNVLLDERRLPWSVLMVVALGAALVVLWRTARSSRGDGVDNRRLLDRVPRFHQATLFFGLQFFMMLTLLSTVVGANWHGARYLLLVEPCWMLLGGAGLVWLVDRFLPGTVWRWIVTAVAALILGWWVWPMSINALSQEAEGYQGALAYTAALRQPGDVVMSPQPPACAWGMGEPCDYYVTQRSWQAYVIQQGDKWVDRWSGAELLNTTDQLVGVLQRAPRTWLITDSERLGRRFEDDFLRVVVEQFDRVYEAQGVTVLMAEGWETPPATTATQRYDPPVTMGPLALLGWERGEISTEGRVPMTFFWRKVGEIDEQINTSMQLITADGAAVTQDDGPPARGMTATFDFERVVLPDPKAPILPAAPIPGRYRIDVVAYRVGDRELLSEPMAVDWIWLGPLPAPPDTMLDATWQDGVRLVGHDSLPAELQPGALLNLRLVWSATTTPHANYTVFVHLLDVEGNIVAQSDRAPEGGFYPTSQWDAGEVVSDSYQLALPASISPGSYQLVIGLYDPVTGARLARQQGEDTLLLANWLMP